MSKVTYTMSVSQNTDTDFRAWGSALSAGLASAGLVQTADTGQINWTTVARAAANDSAGYEIWRMADAMQATKPVFIKLEYGSGSSSGVPFMWLTVGSGSNGSGTITGTYLSRTLLTPNGGMNPDGGGRTTYISIQPGFVGVVINGGCIAWSGNNMSCGYFFVIRTTDDSAVPTADGLTVIHQDGGSGPLANAHLLPGSPKSHSSSGFCLIPGFIPYSSGSVTPDGPQAFSHTFFYPKAYRSPFTVSVIDVEVGAGVSFQATPFGATERTFLCLGKQLINGTASQGGTAVTMAMIWE